MSAPQLSQGRPLGWAEYVALVQKTYPGLRFWLDFVRVPVGMVIRVFDHERSDEPALILQIRNTDLERLFSARVGGGMVFPAMTNPDWMALQTTGETPPGVIMVENDAP